MTLGHSKSSYQLIDETRVPVPLCVVTMSTMSLSFTVSDILSLIFAMVTSEIKLFQNYFRLRRRQFAIISFRLVKACMKLFQNYFTGSAQLINILQHVQCG